MTQRLVICLFVAALLGAGAALWSVAAGHGLLVALLAYCGTSSIAMLGLAIACIPREEEVHHPALLPAPDSRTAA